MCQLAYPAPHPSLRSQQGIQLSCLRVASHEAGARRSIRVNTSKVRKLALSSAGTSRIRVGCDAAVDLHPKPSR